MDKIDPIVIALPPKRSRKRSSVACCQAGQGQAPARQAALAAGLPYASGAGAGQCGTDGDGTKFRSSRVL